MWVGLKRGDQPTRAGLKGAAGCGKLDDVSTAGANAVSDEARSESRDRSRSGLSK
ncbi:MAG: hypothetical protein J07HN6_00191 [Halonotius sp. J07HN6]|nr:MAG: hypothetical protein J07HN6_00191 [Halonotius sp. J07HN6]